MKLLSEVCSGLRVNPLNCGVWIKFINFDGGLQSLIDCLVLYLTVKLVSHQETTVTIINVEIIGYIIGYISHKLCLLTTVYIQNKKI